MTLLKGGDLLIRAVHYASSRLGGSVRLTMIGDGPQRGEWQALASALGVSSRFTGWLTGDDRCHQLRTASVLAVPSIWPEPFGLVGLEAGAVGVPAIAMNTGGISEWLRDKVNGVAVSAPASPQAFGEALASLLADRDRLSNLRVGAHRLATEMTVTKHVDRLETIFRTATAYPPARAVPIAK
jgi:glycosyltransferase involved in cell wall biosynthesis